MPKYIQDTLKADHTAAKKGSLILLVIVYLAGIFMGAIDTGIVTPARTIIQNQLGVDDQTGIWMITIYTLAYAAAIPIMGKLADRYGRKYVYLTSIFLFGLGSLFCGLSQSFESFTMMLIARAVQAIGGGGIIPIATAEFGTSFPEEKRGVALGLVGGVYGIANIFGASAGSGILDIFGIENWSYIFYINLPITLFIMAAGVFVLKNKTVPNAHRLDLLGIVTLTTMVLSLLYGLKNIDFFNLSGTISNSDVLPFLLLFIGLLPLFIFIESKAKDPVMHLKYFMNRNILITMLISLATGISLMGVIFVPQFSENALRIATGSGGYLVIILGLFAGIGAPISGKLIDKYGVKSVLGAGLIISLIGALFMVYVTVSYPNLFTVIFGLTLVGTGMGFTIGTPLNYMMLANTSPKEANSALAALSLVRSLGTAVAPAIMIGFIAHAGASIQGDVMSLMPKEIHVPQLPYAREIDEAFKALKDNEAMKDKLKGVEIPDLLAMETISVDFGKVAENQDNAMVTITDEMIEEMRSSDVTTIVKKSQRFAEAIFLNMIPKLTTNIESGIYKGQEGIQAGIEEIQTAQTTLNEGYIGLKAGIEGMNKGIVGQGIALTQLEKMKEMLSSLPPGMPMPYQAQNLAQMLPPSVLSSMPSEAVKMLEQLKDKKDLNTKMAEISKNLNDLTLQRDTAQNSLEEMATALNAMKRTAVELKALNVKMDIMKAAVPQSLNTAMANYLKEIEVNGSSIETTFQSTLNKGFKNVYLMTMIASLSGLILLSFYESKKLATLG